jgi:diguanylate cyclase (GGDEF)-like protein
VVLIGYYSVRGYQRRLEEMASTDKLTGAANRHVFDLIFRHVVTSAWRRREPVSLIEIDLDRFKQVNDTYGHPAGDAVLRKVTNLVREQIRESDTLCRWGGDEFFVLLVNCPLDCATGVGEKIRAALKERPLLVSGREVDITVSIGVVQYAEGEDLPTLAKRADAALYTAKREGRDRVVQA